MRPRPEPVDIAAIRFWSPVEVRYSDLDAQGHVNNAVYFTYFEQARVAFIHALHLRGLAAQQGWREGHAPQLQAAPASDMAFVIVSADCVYRRPISALAPVVVGVYEARCTHTTMELRYAVCSMDHTVVYATGSTLVASVDLASGRPRALPEWSRWELEELPEDKAPLGEVPHGMS
jgi:acyl-CoA thioester hydrolase